MPRVDVSTTTQISVQTACIHHLRRPAPLPEKFRRNVHNLRHLLSNPVKAKPLCFQPVTALQLLNSLLQNHLYKIAVS
jgi:hypothetical protein